MNTIDIKTAFLQGERIDRVVYVIPPEEAESMGLWRLDKCVYGLIDASRKWYVSLSTCLISVGASISTADPAVFYMYELDATQGLVAIHVHDILWGGTSEFITKVIDHIRSSYQIGQENAKAFRYIGLDIAEKSDCIMVDQIQYISNLKKLQFETTALKDNLRAAIGQLLWVSRHSRPDASFDVCQLSNSLKDAESKDIMYANKIIKYLQQTDVKLMYHQLGDDKHLKLIVYVDAAHGNLRDGGSQEGYLIFLVGEEMKCCLLNWQSKRIKRVTRSSLAAETLALSDAVDDSILISSMISEIFLEVIRNCQ